MSTNQIIAARPTILDVNEVNLNGGTCPRPKGLVVPINVNCTEFSNISNPADGLSHPTQKNKKKVCDHCQSNIYLIIPGFKNATSLKLETDAKRNELTKRVGGDAFRQSSVYF